MSGELRKRLPGEFPGNTFYFLPADIVTQILNFGLPAPIDIQIEGANIQANRDIANKILDEIRQVPGIVDRASSKTSITRRSKSRSTERRQRAEDLPSENVATSLLISLSGSFQTTPTFFLNWQNGVNYNLATQTPQYRIQSLQDLQSMPITSANMKSPEILADVASITRSNEMAVLNHYNIRRVVDVYASVQDRDLGAVGREITRIIDANQKLLPRGSFITVRGQLATMRTSYIGLLAGLGFAIVLGLSIDRCKFPVLAGSFHYHHGFARRARRHHPSSCFLPHHAQCSGVDGAQSCAWRVATANSILIVSFAKERLIEHGTPSEAAIESGFTRFRPVLMTASRNESSA
jgi:multidrug efflux pump subunit AcrB